MSENLKKKPDSVILLPIPFKIQPLPSSLFNFMFSSSFSNHTFILQEARLNLRPKQLPPALGPHPPF